MNKTQTGIWLTLATLLVSLALVAALALPALAGSPKNGPQDQDRHSPVGENLIEGTAEGSITVTGEDDAVVEFSLPTEAVVVEYSLSDSVYSLRSFRLAADPDNSSAPAEDDLLNIEGTAAGTLSVTTEDGTTLTFEMPSDTVVADYYLSDEINILIGLRVEMAKPEPGTAPDNCTDCRLEGTITGTLTLTSDEDTLELTAPEETVVVEYDLTDEVYTLVHLRLTGVEPEEDSTLPEILVFSGTASGTLTLTLEDETVITLEMPSETLEAHYTVADDVNTLIGLKIAGDDDKPGDDAHKDRNDNRRGDGPDCGDAPDTDDSDSSSGDTEEETTVSNNSGNINNNPGYNANNNQTQPGNQGNSGSGNNRR